ncbi:hypothetical protein FPV67DRAFT_1492254 [Lyophyllum atratum]|nr:hypothetical protein FPV67DRAFT_1492254 [Lyophyllum atratum]
MSCFDWDLCRACPRRALNVSVPGWTPFNRTHALSPTEQSMRKFSDGRPYEFTSVPTEAPPADLINEFKALIEPFPGVLGLYYAGVDGKDKPSVLLERTEGRVNITEAVTPEQAKGQVETAWIPARERFGPVTMACSIYCDTRNTRGTDIHKDTKTHLRS